MTIKHISMTESRAVFKLGDIYIVVETTSNDKVRNFQNGLIVETLLNKECENADMSLHNIHEIVADCRNISVVMIE